MLSLIIPVYKNEENLPLLLTALGHLHETCLKSFASPLEVVFVVDGSPDQCFKILKEKLPTQPFSAQLVALSRNFGSFAAIRTGLNVASGTFFAVMAADLQEPPELVTGFFEALTNGHADVVVGKRIARDDPFFSRMASALFWRFYKSFVVKDMPVGGVDIFGCNDLFRKQLLTLDESHSSLVGLIYWLGFRRVEIPYTRKPREIGVSAWSTRKKMNYMFDSLFAFTDLPVRLLVFSGVIGVLISVLFSTVVLLGKLFGEISVPGYTATVLCVVFFGGINTLGIGIIGNYTWRAYENTKKRPLSVTLRHESFKKNGG